MLLIDTFDTLEGARAAAEAARVLAAEGIRVAGVRLDSGDLAALASGVRAILDEAGFPGIRILASGGLDEHSVARLVATGAPIDGFGVGTRLVTGGDDPSLDAVYKLVQDQRGPQMKTSTGKVTLPGVKQAYRVEEAGLLQADTIALADETGVPGWPLLHRVMANGRRLDPPEPPAAARERCRAGLASLPEPLRSLEAAAAPPVGISPGLARLARDLAAGRSRRPRPSPGGPIPLDSASPPRPEERAMEPATPGPSQEKPAAPARSRSPAASRSRASGARPPPPWAASRRSPRRCSRPTSGSS